MEILEKKVLAGAEIQNYDHGMLTIILKGEVSVRLTSSSLLVRNQLFQEKLRIFFTFSKQPCSNR